MLPHTKFRLFSVLLLALPFLPACTHVYLEKPMPQSGAAVDHFPAEWLGLYREENEEEKALPDSPYAFFTECYRIAQAGSGQVLISIEARMHKDDFPKLERWLQVAMKSGRLSGYVLSERFILMRDFERQDSTGARRESQSIALYPAGDWFVWGASAAPLFLYDFENKSNAQYEITRCTALEGSPDSLKMEFRTMAAREKKGALYLNFKEESSGLWDWLNMRSPRAGTLVLTTPAFENHEKFKTEFEAYNKITPFTQIDSSNAYRINPSDAAFETLLADKDLFSTMVLKKIE